METITLTHDNLESEHICCAIASDKDVQVKSKKEWLKEQLDRGLIFTKMNVRGKCFIEYIPIENAWVPVKGKDMMYIDCLWVSGQYQGKGYAKELLEDCKKRSLELGKKGLIIISSQKKKGFLMDYKFLVKHGFYSVDVWNEIYELMFLPLTQDYQEPHFNVQPIKEEGLVLYYTSQCPFNAKYTQVLKEYCDQQKIPLKLKHILTCEQAQNAPTPLTTYSLFYNKVFITREVLNARKFEKIWGQIYEED
jgi:GNAT superfamily N-acetyltransferase